MLYGRYFVRTVILQFVIKIVKAVDNITLLIRCPTMITYNQLKPNTIGYISRHIDGRLQLCSK